MEVGDRNKKRRLPVKKGNLKGRIGGCQDFPQIVKVEVTPTYEEHIRRELSCMLRESGNPVVEFLESQGKRARRGKLHPFEELYARYGVRPGRGSRVMVLFL